MAQEKQMQRDERARRGVGDGSQSLLEGDGTTLLQRLRAAELEIERLKREIEGWKAEHAYLLGGPDPEATADARQEDARGS